MKRQTAYEQAADKRVADEVQNDRAGLCEAHGCPNRWAVDAGRGKLCSAHQWNDRRDWPVISAEQQDAAAMRAADAKPVRPQLSPAEKRRVLAQLADVSAGLAKVEAKGWIGRLQEREAAGEKLSIAQREGLAAALRFGAPSNETPEDRDAALRRDDEHRRRLQGAAS